MSTVIYDIRYAFRLLARSPIVSFVAALSLGLGIGANTTIFSLVNEVFLKPLPLEEPSRLVSVFTVDERNRQGFGAFAPSSRPNLLDYRDRNQVFDGLVAHQFIPLSLAGGSEEPEQIPGELVMGEYFTVLGAPLALGRGFLPDEDAAPGGAPVTVLSYGLWQRRFGGDTAIVGKSVNVNGRAFTVVGVTGESFRGTNAIGGPQLWVPFAMYREVTTGFMRDNWESRRALNFNATARLKPGVTIEQAHANINAIATALAEAFPNENRGRSITLVPLAQATFNPVFRQNAVTAGGLLMVVVGLVLLIACANVANLLLARAAARKQEIAVRLSLGASRTRLVRQLLIESLVLAGVGALCGLMVTYWARAALQALRPPFLPADALSMALDGRVLLFTALVAGVTGILFGLAPALQFSRPDLAVELKDRTSQPSSSRGHFTVRNALVVAQVALSFVALVGAGLFLRSLGNARQIDTGFEAEQVAVLTFNLTSQGTPIDAAIERQREILERVRGLPGIEHASYASFAPLAGGGFARTVFLDGQDATDARAGRLVQINAVAEDYLVTVGIPLIRGRHFAATDAAESPRVVIVNETMAKRFWPDNDALGQTFRFFGQPQAIEVVGVARDSKYNQLGEDPQPFIYQPLRQVPQPAVTLHLRSRAPAEALGAARRVVQQMEPNMPLVGVFTMADVFEQALWAPRMGALLLAVFGALALALASIGVYGVMAYTV
ncbi:MAG: ABC transporter permease, partial [Acidobacteria bacterium]|nr:ABC transporter permease [Acidobacteriota bacterium]